MDFDILNTLFHHEQLSFHKKIPQRIKIVSHIEKFMLMHVESLQNLFQII